VYSAASRVELGIALSVAVVHIFLVGFFLPMTHHYLLLPTTYRSLLKKSAKLTLLYRYSKCSQIWVTVSCRHAGPQSIVTTFLNVCEGLVQIWNHVLSDPLETLNTVLMFVLTESTGTGEQARRPDSLFGSSRM
jgi:hypothetical protein